MSPFIGSDAIATGMLTRGQLRAKYTAVHPDVYLERGTVRTLAVNTRAAALWARGVVTGVAAAAVHGVSWIDSTTPIEVIAPNRRRRQGVIVRDERITADEILQVGELRVATPARTAFDLARHLPRHRAVSYLDALTAATRIDPLSIDALAARYPGARGIRQAQRTLPLVDGGAQSPKETWLRLLVIDAGFPRPSCQIKVQDGYSTAFIDMGWRDSRIGLEYEGGQHYSDRNQFVRDIGRYEMLSQQGWLIIRIVKEHSRGFILQRVRDAFLARSIEIDVRVVNPGY